jgi:hypothetical protein
MQPLLPLTNDELAMVTGATTLDGVKALVEEVREWITQGHRSPGINVRV